MTRKGNKRGKHEQKEDESRSSMTVLKKMAVQIPEWVCDGFTNVPRKS